MKKETIKNLSFEPPTKAVKYEKFRTNYNQMNQKSKFILEREIQTKTHNPLSEVLQNLNDEGKFFVSKTRRIGKYNSNNKIAQKELILDRRNELIQTQKTHSSSFKKKPNYLEFRNKKYIQTDNKKKVYPQKIIRLKVYSIDSIPNYFHRNLRPYNFNLNQELDNSQKAKNNLNSIISMGKDQFMEEYNKAKENEKKWNYFPKPRQRQFIMDRTPLANFYSRKRDIKTFISPQNAPLPYISILDDDYSFSEKLRFQNMMQKLTKLKLCIESNPKKEYDIVKEFLLSNKLFDVDNFQVNKLKNFLHFIKGDFLLDPTKNIKENILDILNGNEIEKPHISNELNDFKNADFKNELIKQNIKNIQKNYPNNLIEDKEDNEDCIVKNLKRYPPKIILSPNESNSMSVHKKPKSKIKVNSENNLSSIYHKSLSKSQMIERLLTKKYHEIEKFHNNNINLTEKQKEKIKNFKCLPLNLRRQKEIYLSSVNDNLDLNKNPKFIIKLLEKKFKDEEKEDMDERAKTVSNWKKVLKSNNEKLYGEKKNNSDYEELKKRNMLTEYICLMKAKNKYEINKLQKKYKL